MRYASILGKVHVRMSLTRLVKSVSSLWISSLPNGRVANKFRTHSPNPASARAMQGKPAEGQGKLKKGGLSSLGGAEQKGMTRNSSWIWDWKQSPASSRDNSSHGGNLWGSKPDSLENSSHGGTLFGPSRDNSTHGGNKMKRNVSFSQDLTDLVEGKKAPAWPDQSPSKSPPVMDGTGGGMRRNKSWIWDWKTATPPASLPASRDNSLRGGNVFGAIFTPSAPVISEISEETAPAQGGAGQAEAPGGLGEGLKRSMSFIWDWGKYRTTPPSTPGNSLHAGSAFAGAFDKEEEGEEGEEARRMQPAIEPPRAMVKNHSIGSFMWNWGQSRVSPPSTPGNSLHRGNAWAAEPEDASVDVE